MSLAALRLRWTQHERWGAVTSSSRWA